MISLIIVCVCVCVYIYIYMYKIENKNVKKFKWNKSFSGIKLRWNVHDVLELLKCESCFIIRVKGFFSGKLFFCAMVQLGVYINRFLVSLTISLIHAEMHVLKIHKHGVNRCLGDTHTYSCHGPQSLLTLEKMKLGKVRLVRMHRILPFFNYMINITQLMKLDIRFLMMKNDKMVVKNNSIMLNNATEKSLYTDISIKYKFFNNHK